MLTMPIYQINSLIPRLVVGGRNSLDVIDPINQNVRTLKDSISRNFSPQNNELLEFVDVQKKLIIDAIKLGATWEINYCPKTAQAYYDDAAKDIQRLSDGLSSFLDPMI